MWHEEGFGGGGGWRGAVDHLGHDRRLYFSALGDLFDFIRAGMTAEGGESRSTAEAEGHDKKNLA